MENLDHLWPYPRHIEAGEDFPAPRGIALQGDVAPRASQDNAAPRTLRSNAVPRVSRDEDDPALLHGRPVSGSTLPPEWIRELHSLYPAAQSAEESAQTGSGYPLRLGVEDLGKAESYRLELDPSGALLVGHDPAGLAHGAQTLLQLLHIFRRRGSWTRVLIRDWPAFRKRGFMVDMGRSVFPLAMLRRIVRILARLKMNQLHLHLYDDELCGLRFRGLPFGKENPYALQLDDLAELVSYAAARHVEIVPELESWGHVGSLVHHRPDLRGSKGMYGGSSFRIGDAAFSLMGELIEQVAQVMPDRWLLHLGMDEAHWFPAPECADYTPARMLRRYFDLVQGVADRCGQDITLRLWADHAGRPVDADLQPHVIIEPWQYWIANREMIDAALERYSGEGKMRWMAAAGQSLAQYRGAYHASRYWCRRAADSPNVEGVNIAFWGANDLAEKFITLFAGAYYAWNPHPPTPFADQEDYESFDRAVFPIMQAWQQRVPDARPDAMMQDRGPLVFNGYYLWGPHHGTPVAPTAPEAGTLYGHDFLHE